MFDYPNMMKTIESRLSLQDMLLESKDAEIAKLKEEITKLKEQIPNTLSEREAFFKEG
jgi:uncharacterized coiled-coil protein SlyX